REVGFEFAARLLFGATQARLDRLDQFGVRNGLGQVVIGAEIHATAEVVLFTFSSEKNKWDTSKRDVGLQRLEDPIAVQLWHHHVAENQVRFFATGRFDASSSVFCRKRFVIVKTEQCSDVPA